VRGGGSRLAAVILLAWALDREGVKVHAGRLDPRVRRARAPFTCLGCGEPLVPRLGRVRARHFAHRPGSTCPLTSPESALHLDAKERLLALCLGAFSGALPVTLLTRCSACRRPSPRDLAGLGDSAEEEGAVGPLRADVLVRRSGRPSLAIEVRVTHAVDAGKEEALLAAGVPAVEIDAREDWEGEADGRATIAPARGLGFPPCDRCVAESRADVDRARGGEAAEIAELESYRARGLLRAERVPAPGPRRAPGADPSPDAPIAAGERKALGRRFRCPECGSRELAFGDRIARHACPGGEARPVAWRGYAGALVELGWWRR